MDAVQSLDYLQHFHTESSLGISVGSQLQMNRAQHVRAQVYVWWLCLMCKFSIQPKVPFIIEMEQGAFFLD